MLTDGADKRMGARQIQVREQYSLGIAQRKAQLQLQLGVDGVRSMRSTSEAPLFLTFALSKGATQGKSVWIQLAQAGDYRGHPQGPFVLNRAVFDTIIHNFRANPDGRVPIDFEHASEVPPTSGSIPTAGAPAQGWITDLRTDGAKLFALVEWGDLARQYIASGQYKFISPSIRFRSRDPVSNKQIGPELSSAGLTNSPFLRGQEPLVASARGAQ